MSHMRRLETPQRFSGVMIRPLNESRRLSAPDASREPYDFSQPLDWVELDHMMAKMYSVMVRNHTRDESVCGRWTRRRKSLGGRCNAPRVIVIWGRRTDWLLVFHEPRHSSRETRSHRVKSNIECQSVVEEGTVSIYPAADIGGSQDSSIQR